MNERPVFSTNPGRVAVKICGIRTGAQAEAVINAGADALGINFYPKSKRFVALDEALPWLNEISDSVPRVAVTVNATDDELERIADSGGIDWIQLHGNETPDRLKSLIHRGLPVFRALGVKDKAMLQSAAAYPGTTLLLDAYAPTEYGGSGETMDWKLGAQAVQQWPDRQIVLAGGLVPDNVARAVKQVQPAGVDVASGIESEPGVKDLGLVRAFIEAARV
jgi:phosphoribosylanthranilate isomerase